MLYDQLGGEAFFEELVKNFYAGVAEDPILRPLYPEDNLQPAARRLKLFLMQYFGGPTTYSEERGHPRLRMRHMGFAVGEAEQAAWLDHMRRSLSMAGLAPELEEPVWTYFREAAQFLRNR
ncbi:MAG: globin [Vulcanimicrobiota bacterium]